MRTGGLARVTAVSLAALCLAACGNADPVPSDSAATRATPSATSSPGALTDLVRLTGQLSGRQVVDGSGNGRDGQALGTADGVVGGGTVADPYLSFTKRLCLEDAGCPTGVVVLDPAAKSLVPADGGRGPFTYGATIRLTVEPPEEAGMNVMQRGLFGQGLSQWKLQADYGKPSCRWSDGTRTIQLPNKQTEKPPVLTVGRWYELRCERTASGALRLVVKDVAGGPTYRAETDGSALGAVLPTGPVLIGANSVSGESQELSDQLHADVRDVVFATSS